MKRGQLVDYFAGAGAKRLSAVDAEPRMSNQHEVGTTRKMRDDFLEGGETRRFDSVFIWLGADEDVVSTTGSATHYDARAGHPTRKPEWRLYYPTNSVTEAMQEGDTLFLARTHEGRLFFIVTAAASTSEQQLCWLFGLRPDGRSFVSRGFFDTDPELEFAARYIFEQIGIDYEDPEAGQLDGIIEQFGTSFPTTARFSALARNTLPDIRVEDGADKALVAWLDREESLFLRLEKRVVAERLEQGFLANEKVDVDGFIGFSLSVQNRRKSRMGHSLENHLEAIFKAGGIRHVRGAITENRQRPDFLFPSLEAYQNAPDQGDPGISMLGAKSSCKDRWRQVLAEAKKIREKHLLTLEPGISAAQTDQMKAAGLQLVVPGPVQGTYTSRQKEWLLSLSEFLEHLRSLQTQDRM